MPFYRSTFAPRRSANAFARSLLASSAILLVATTSPALAATTTLTPSSNPGSADLGAGDSLVLTGGSVVVGSDSAGDFTYDGTVSGDGGLTKAGGQTLTLNAANSYTGGTTVTAGTLTAAVEGALPTNGDVIVSGGTLKLDADQAIGNLSGAGTVNVGASTLTTNVTSGTTRFDGSITDAIQKLGYIGSWRIGSGPSWNTNPQVLNAQETAALLFGGDASDYSISSISSNVAAIDYMAWGSGYAGFATSTPVAQNYSVDAGAAGYGQSGDFSTYVLDWNSDKVNYAFALVDTNGGGGLTKTGAGTLILGGTNTYTGTTLIQEGTLALDGGSAIADAGAVEIGSLGMLEIMSDETIGSLAGSGKVLLDANLTAGGNNTDTTYSGTITGAGGLAKIGTGTLTLAGTDDYAGITSISAGTLALAGGSAIADTGTVEIGSAGTLRVLDTETIGSLSGSGSAVLDADLTTGGNNASTAYAGSISGSGGLTKTGTGTLALAGTNTYTGTTSISEGTLAVSGGNALSDTGAVEVGSGGTLRVASAETIGSLAGNGSVILDGNLTTGGNGADTTYAGLISGSAGLVKTGTGTLTLTGLNSYAGGSSVLEGTLVGSSASISGDLFIDASATTVFDQSQDGTYAGAISGSGAVVKTGSAALGLSGNSSSFAGTTQIDEGRVILTGALGGNATISEGAILQVGSGDTAGNLIADTRNDGTLLFAGSADAVHDSEISGTGSLVKTGTGTLALAGINTYTGTTSISEGTLAVSGGNALSDTGAVEVGSGGTLRVASAETIGSLAGNGSVILDGNLTTGGNGADTTYAGLISGSASLVKTGTGTLTLTGLNSYAGGSSVLEGTLVGSSASISGDLFIDASATTVFDQSQDGTYAGAISGSGAVVKTGSAALGLSGNSSSFAGTTQIDEGRVILTGALGGNATISEGAILQVGSGGSAGSLIADTRNDGTLLFAGSADAVHDSEISGTGSLVKTGTGTLTLTGLNTYAGGSSVLEGTLVGSSASISGDLFVNTSATTVFDQSQDGTYAGAISGSGAVVKTGSAALGLSGNSSSFAGTTQIDEGRVILTGALGGNATISEGAILQVGSGDTAGNLIADTRNDGTLLFAGSADAVHDSEISGTGSLVKTGTGTLALAGINTYTGTTSISEGTLAVSGGNALSDTGAVEVGSGGTLRVASAETIGSLAGNGSVILDGNLTTGGNGADTTYAGLISGSAGLVKTGTGTLTLTGLNSYAGGSSVLEGTLVGSSASISGDLFIDASATTVFDQSQDGTYAGAISGSGAVVKTGSAALGLSGNSSSFAGTTQIDEGRVILTGALGGNATISEGAILQVGSGGSAGSLIADTRNDGTLLFAGSADAVHDSEISGTGSLVKTGTGTLTLTGLNSYAGGSSVLEGTLVGSSASISGDLFVNTSATTVFDQSQDGTYAGAISGSGAVVKTGSAALGLSGNSSSFAGTTQIDEGRVILTGALGGNATISEGAILQVGSGDTAGSLIADTRNDGTLLFAGSADAVHDSEISGTGSLVKIGDGTLTLAGSYIYSGATIVEGGRLKLASVLNSASTLQVDAGTFDLGGLTQTISALSGAGGMVLIGAGGELTVDQASDTAYYGALAGAGDFVKAGSGTLTLLGDSTLTGVITVGEGGLETSGKLAATVAVNDGAYLAATGSLGGLSVRSGGTVAPGGTAIGTLTVNGKVQLAAGSTYQMTVNAAGSGDLIAATGSAEIDGSKLEILANNGSYASTTHYTLLTAAGGVEGTFDSVTTDLAFLTPILSYDTTAAYVDLLRNDVSFAGIGKSQNQRGVAAKVELLGIDSSIYRSLLYMNAAGARSQFDQLTGEIHSSTQTAILNDAALARQAVLDHVSTTPAHSGLWLQGLSNWATISADGEASRTKSNVQGMIGGFDIALDEANGVRFGAAFGYTDDTSRAAIVDSKARLKGAHYLAYAAGNVAGLKLQIGGGYSHVSSDVTRSLEIAQESQSLFSSYNARLVQGFAEASHEFALAGGSVEPYGRVAIANIKREAFAENGGDAALTGAAAKDTTTMSSLGIRFGTPQQGPVSVHGKVGWDHVWGNVSPVTDMVLAGTTGSFQVYGAAQSRDSAALSLGIALRVEENMTLSAGYDGRIGTQGASSAVRAAITFRF